MAEEGFLADPSVVGVLVDEALTRGRDQDAADQTARRRDRDGDLAGVHAGHVGARAHRHADRAAVVAVDAEAPAAPLPGADCGGGAWRRSGRSRRRRARRRGAPARRSSRPSWRTTTPATRPSRSTTSVSARASHRIVAPARSVAATSRCIRNPPAALAMLRLVGARDRRRQRVEGVGVLAAREDEAVVGRRLHRRLGVEAPLEGHAVGLEPVEVRDALRRRRARTLASSAAGPHAAIRNVNMPSAVSW